MKKLLPILLLLLSVSVSAQLKDIIKNRPNPPRLINDYSNTLTAEQVQSLEDKMVAYDKQTSNQITVVIVNTLAGDALEDGALEIMRQWGVGTKQNNNGVVVLVAKNDRKITIQVGDGLEGQLTDLVSQSIIDNDITPNFKQGNYYRGLDEATDDIIKAAADRYKAPEGYYKKKVKGIGFGIIIAILIMIFLFSGGGGGGGMASRRGYGDVITGSILGSLLGGRGGGWSGGGGGFGGGGGGGGFGGFGGGSGSGGGASGSW